ncbi:MAG: MBL fold metallo-hydrolase [Candidatus Binatia bacterium]|nr:MAG: MBL fold metallo-hydrolase [Candidatus Binatia bacterium]
MSVRVTFLGAGDAFGSGGRCMAAYLVETPTTSLLLDCGPTILTSSKRHGVDLERVDAVVLSHLHGDHFGGLPFLFLEYLFERPRKRPLVVAGPAGTPGRVHALFRTMYRDLAREGLAFPVEYLPLSPRRRATIGDVVLYPFRVPHQKKDVSLGFRLETNSRVLVYSGDSGWTEALVRHSRDADLFVCECCFFETRVDFHLDYPRIAENRSRLSCKRLVLSHLGREVLARADEVREELAFDGLVVEL